MEFLVWKWILSSLILLDSCCVFFGSTNVSKLIVKLIFDLISLGGGLLLKLVARIVIFAPLPWII